MGGTRLIALTVLASGLLLLGCGGTEEGAQEAGKKEEAGSRTIGVTFMSLSNPFFQACKRSIREVVEAHGDQVMEVNAEHSSGTQLNGVENFLQAGAACILLNPVNSDAAASAVKKANAAGVPVVTFDVTATKGQVECFVESNNTLAGRLCADYVGWRLRGTGRIVILDHPEVTSVRQRTTGFTERLAAAYPNVEIVDTQLGKGRKEVGLRVTENLLRAHPDIDAIFAINDPSALGAVQAVRAAQSTQVFVVGIDGAPDAIDELKKEDTPLAMTVAQFPQQIGRVAAHMAYKVLADEPVPDHVRIGVMPVTKDSLAQYPGWEGAMPERIAIPWQTDMTIGEPAEKAPSKKSP